MTKYNYSGICGAAMLVCIFFLASCNMFKEMKPVYQVEKIAAKGIESIKLSSTCAEVSFTSVSENKDDIHILLSGSTSSDTILFRTDVVGNQLEIEYEEVLNIIGGFQSKMKLTVEIPETLLSKIDLNTVSGNLDARNLTADSITLKTTSGTLSATAFTGPLTATSTSGKMTIDTINGTLIANNSSGAIEAKNITGNTSVKTVSGKIAVTGVTGTVNADSTSGAIGIEGLTGALITETSSGAISVQFENGVYDTTAKSTSGSISILLPAASSFEYHMQSTSGSKECDFKNSDSGTVGSGGPKIELKTTSGSIQIREIK